MDFEGNEHVTTPSQFEELGNLAIKVNYPATPRPRDALPRLLLGIVSSRPILAHGLSPLLPGSTKLMHGGVVTRKVQGTCRTYHNQLFVRPLLPSL